MKLIFIILFILLLVLLLGLIYEQYARYSSKKGFVDNGTYVDVGGHKLHYRKKGKGTPVVVFEAGFDIRGHLPWKKVQNEVSQFATTIAYDRAGILRSERGNNKKSCENIAQDLHRMLKKLQVNKPILVGHSFGGLVIRCYIKKYPNEVSGIILVDANNPEIIEKAPKELAKKIKLPRNLPQWLITTLSTTGIARIAVKYQLYKANETDENIKEEVNAYMASTISSLNEDIGCFEKTLDESKGVSFGNIPLTVILATKSKTESGGMRKYFNKLQEDSLQLSTNSKLIRATESSHFIQLDEPNIIIDAIKEMVVREH